MNRNKTDEPATKRLLLTIYYAFKISVMIHFVGFSEN